MSWQQVILHVLEDAGIPMTVREITQHIGEHGLYDLSNTATPGNTVGSVLSRMTRQEGDLYEQYGDIVQRVAWGVYEFIDSTDGQLGENGATAESEEEEPDQAEDETAIPLIPVFGEYWERDKVDWKGGINAKLLGYDAVGAKAVNFAQQRGIYLLYKGGTVVYVGRAIKYSLHNRLRRHVVTKSKAIRWDRFSWFGLDGVSKDGNLEKREQNISSEDLIKVMEAVLIEALEPPINVYRGEKIGVRYAQHIDTSVEQKRIDALKSDIAASIGSALQNL